MSAHPFTDPVSSKPCVLEVIPGCPPGVRHPGCGALADVSAQLDAFYCPACAYNGRISGAWVVGLLRSR